jgi:DeoR family transcriptional regulator of aga operon
MANTTSRQVQILELLAWQGDIEVEDISKRLQISPSTVRRELRALEENGLLVRSYGRAKLPAPIAYEAPYERRAATQVAAKRAIAAAARRLIEPSSVVGISGGTTCTELARQLRAMAGSLTIVTNAVNIAVELQGQPDKRVMVCGGFMNLISYELVGNLVLQSLQNVHLDIAFLGCSGIDLQFGFSMSDEPEAAVARAFMSVADRTVMLADHSKMGRATFARLCPLADVNLLITDADLAADDRQALAQAGLSLIVAEPLG